MSESSWSNFMLTNITLRFRKSNLQMHRLTFFYIFPSTQKYHSSTITVSKRHFCSTIENFWSASLRTFRLVFFRFYILKTSTIYHGTIDLSTSYRISRVLFVPLARLSLYMQWAAVETYAHDGWPSAKTIAYNLKVLHEQDNTWDVFFFVVVRMSMEFVSFCFYILARHHHFILL